MAVISKQQKAFITYYFNNGLNATKAAIDAGYSEKSAMSIGCMLLKKPHIAAKIEELKQEIADKIEIDVEWLQNELVTNVHAARNDGKYADSNNAIKMIGELIGAFQKEKDSGITVNVLELLGNVPARAEEKQQGKARQAYIEVYPSGEGEAGGI